MTLFGVFGMIVVGFVSGVRVLSYVVFVVILLNCVLKSFVFVLYVLAHESHMICLRPVLACPAMFLRIASALFTLFFPPYACLIAHLCSTVCLMVLL